MPQGYTESPTYFSQILKADLADVYFPNGFALIQYIDGLLLCPRTEQDCQRDTIHLLQQLASKGHKVSKNKLQFCLPIVR